MGVVEVGDCVVDDGEDVVVVETPVDRFTDCRRKRAIASSRGSATTVEASSDDKSVMEMT